jgi:hypothetical protein
MRMPQERWPAKIHPWIPPERRKRERHRRSWRDCVKEAMKKGGWLQKMHRTGYFGEENREGSRSLYKPIYIHTHTKFLNRIH